MSKNQFTKFNYPTHITPSNAIATIILLTRPIPIPGQEKKLTQTFIFTLLCGDSKGFKKVLIKVFYKKS